MFSHENSKAPLAPIACCALAVVPSCPSLSFGLHLCPTLLCFLVGLWKLARDEVLRLLEMEDET